MVFVSSDPLLDCHNLGKKCVSDHLLIVLFKFSMSFIVLSVKYLF